MSNNQRGQIITFYSFKGGTGRTMALANVACILANRQKTKGGKGVLMIDWDLEAPGLHRYFRNGESRRQPGLTSLEGPSDLKPGLIDLFYELDKQLDQQSTSGGERPSESRVWAPGSENLARAAINNVDLQRYITATTEENLGLLRAGRFNPKDPEEYSERVNKFNWEALYNKSPHLIRAFAEALADKYAFVLVDSRTGVTDISGICTTLLPEKLVVVFTPNTQSLQGGLDLIRRATDYRKESADLRPLVVFPLVSRVEANEPDLRRDWRFGNSGDDTVGYQPEFEKLLTDIYGEKEVSLDKYFDEMQVQHIPRYAYGEEIAVLVERISDKFSLSRSYQSFAASLVDSRSPWASETKDIDSSGGGTKRFQALTNLLRERLSSRATKRKIRTALFTSIVLIAISGIIFSIKFGADLREERQKSSRLQQQLDGIQQKLTLYGKIEQVEISKSSSGDAEIFILLSIKNYGPPTPVDKYSLRITHIYSRSFEFKGPPVDLKGTFRAGKTEDAVQPQESIQSNASQPLDRETTVRGWLKFVLPLPDLQPDFLEQTGMRYVVSFSDNAGNSYETVYEML